MRGAALAVLAVFCAAAQAATPAASADEAPIEVVGLRSIAGWLRAHGTDGYLGADVARALGIEVAGAQAMLDARQRGFRNDAGLRIAQLLADGSVLFMVQAPGGEVTFYHSTLRGGLVRALVSIPARKLVLPLERAEAQSSFRAELLYWEDKAVNR